MKIEIKKARAVQKIVKILQTVYKDVSLERGYKNDDFMRNMERLMFRVTNKDEN